VIGIVFVLSFVLFFLMLIRLRVIFMFCYFSLSDEFRFQNQAEKEQNLIECSMINKYPCFTQLEALISNPLEINTQACVS
jgi:hypothetical protein